MPRKDKAGRADYSREYMRKFRAAKRDRERAIALEVASLVEGASTNREPLAPPDPESIAGITHGAATAILKVLLDKHGITTERILAKLSQMIDAQRLRAIGNGEVQLQDCHDVQLKGIIFAAKLLQMTGALPPSRQFEPVAPISVRVMMLSGGGMEMRPLLPSPEDDPVSALTVESEKA